MCRTGPVCGKNLVYSYQNSSAPTDVDGMLMGKKTGQDLALTSAFSVELPGIEPVQKRSAKSLNMTTRNDAQQREATCGYTERC